MVDLWGNIRVPDNVGFGFFYLHVELYTGNWILIGLNEMHLKV